MKHFTDSTNEVHLQKRSFDQAFQPTVTEQQSVTKAATGQSGTTIRLNFSLAKPAPTNQPEESPENGEISDPMSNFSSEGFEESPEAGEDE
jgi:hypothetical protein